MLQEILCWRCKDVVKTKEVTHKNCTSTKIGTKLCKICRKKHIDSMVERNKSKVIRDKNSIRMKKKNPMHSPETRAKQASTVSGEEKDVKDYLIIKKDIPTMTREEMSERMKKDNPMFNKETRDRATKTFNEKIKSGEIKYKKGPEHHLWKGNRSFSLVVRCQLYPMWTKVILIRDNFNCTLCGSTNKSEMQVHHIKPLRDFTEEIKVKYDIQTFMDINSDNWQQYVDEIINNHNLCDGITVCRKCHSKIDKYYHIGDKDED